MTDRQRERLDKLGIIYQGDETIEEAANLLRTAMQNTLYLPIKPSPLLDSALVIMSEGDCGGGKQWLE